MAELPAVFHCQSCKARLNITGQIDAGSSLDPKSGFARQQQSGLTSAALDLSRIDESFILLDDRRPGGPAAAGARGLEESFVVLGSASVLKQGVSGLAPAGISGATPSPSSSAAATAAAAAAASEREAGPDAQAQRLQHIFELASTSTQVDHPLCLDCAQQLKDELAAQSQEAEAEIAAYAAALQRLQAEAGPAPPLAADAFAEALARARRELAEEEGRTAELERQLVAAEAEMSALQAASCEVSSLEERYWRELNGLSHRLSEHVEERDALLCKIDRAQGQLQAMRSSNVYNDAFKIWHDGPFGTISGFRLGRTPEAFVEWDEINAAWGQAVLLLHTMSQGCQLSFTSARLLPMGSHPRVADRKHTYDLFGPVSKLWSASYDRAMVGFLSCLKEFGEFAATRDRAEGRAAAAFDFPFAIDGDKVGGLTIKLTLNKDAKWTKALKFMLADLKVALQWAVRQEPALMAGGAGAMPPALPALGHEGPGGL